jgi:hypothetical protein
VGCSEGVDWDADTDAVARDARRGISWRYSIAKPGIDLPAVACSTLLPAMFVVSEEAAATIRTAYEQEGELSATIELRRLFPGITGNAEARACTRTIAGWKPLPDQADAEARTPSGRRTLIDPTSAA